MDLFEESFLILWCKVIFVQNRNQHEQRKLATAVMCPNVETAVERVEMLFRSWITERTRRLLRTGGSLCFGFD
ncbi:hypothetical protein KIN20_006591 [Parelaphostrongylus tenuis]|uniref:Uncharacterized protein n=1 Tax=Parelaphostrongylus tenuis TaxID=148309 RepID=A0AAD5QIG3_PARTN|nr:hypothetical protein KIN20_006591 [Parelaphostrongylus tenuis]